MIKKDNYTLAIIWILISAFGFSLMALFVKLSGDLPLVQKAFFRNLIASMVAAVPIFINFKNISYPKNKNTWVVIFLRSFFGTLGLLFNFYAIDNLNLADASILQRLTPFVVIIISYFLFKDKITRYQFLIILLSFIGVLFVVKPSFSNIADSAFYVALVGVFFGGAAYSCLRYLGIKGVSAEFIVLYFSLFSTLVLLPYLIFNYQSMSMYQFFILILVGISATLGQFGVTYAYKYASAGKLSVFDYTQVIFAGIFGYAFFYEIPDLLDIIGYIIIIASGIILNKNK